ncbi:synaptobrevin protein [Cardiosporidium cionae]|uniref:Synaptobrevin protein n=1 Tax=Cardiosporidium cionae TaxID=476202 RepID=A0ABQ7J8V5_9APIC|nr:synaptobrevin protein [Cardiosporidium cionae]|eukprot:KAF8820433.1 synaptobrevin protein [Cardiosporidium cionae]
MQTFPLAHRSDGPYATNGTAIYPRKRSLIHSLIAKGLFVTADYSYAEDEENINDLCRKVLQQIPSSKERRCYAYGNLNFNYLFDGEIVFMCVSNRDAPYEIPWKFLGEIRHVYRQILDRPTFSGDSKQAATTRKLKELMDYYNSENPTKNIYVTKQLEDVAEVVKDNIGKVLDRGEQIESLVSKAFNLQGEMETFHSGTRTLRRRTFWQRKKWYILLFGLLLILLFSILSFICGGPFFWSCF